MINNQIQQQMRNAEKNNNIICNTTINTKRQNIAQKTYYSAMESK